MFSVGEILKQERLKQNITLAEIEKKTHIRAKFLQAVESNDWQLFSSKIYIIGIIRSYSKILNLDVKKMLAFFRRDYEKVEDTKFKKRVASRFLHSESKKFSLIGIALLVLLFLSYFLYQLKLYFSPPQVTILAPQVKEFRREDRVKVIGKTEKEAIITILGERVYQDSEGKFEYNFPLLKEKNELTIEVVGANGKKTVVKEIYLKK